MAGDNVYEIVIQPTDGLGQTSDGYLGIVTRYGDNKELRYVTRYKWWMKLWYLNGIRIARDFKYADRREARLKHKENYEK